MTKSRKRQTRRKSGGLATMTRAIVLEGFGIVVLIFLLTVSNTEAAKAETETNQRPVLQQIRNWLDQGLSAFSPEPTGESEADPVAGDTSATEIFPMSEHNSQRQLKVRRAYGFD